MPKIICPKLLSQHHNNLLVGNFGIDKTYKLVIRKYYKPTLYYDVEAYVKSYNIYLASKTICYKAYRNL